MKLKKSKRILITSLVAVIIVVLIVAGTLIYLNINNPDTSNLEQVSITDVQVVFSSILYVAEEQGYFTQNGLNVTFPSTPLQKLDLLTYPTAKLILSNPQSTQSLEQYLTTET